MRGYIIRRLLLAIPTLFLVTLIIFFSFRFIPGDIIDLMVGQMGTADMGREAMNITVEDIRHSLGLDVPIHIQYFNWLGGLLQGDLGESLWTGTPVLETILHRAPVSIELTLFAMITALLIAIPIGTYSAVRQDTWGDYTGRTIAILAICVPSFWLGTMIMIYPSIWWNWSPPLEIIPFFEDPIANLRQFILPGTLGGLVIAGTIMRMTRTMMLEVLRQDYIRTAWAKGLKEGTIISRHAMRNALIPVVTVTGVMLALLISGSVVIEQIFGLPGIGLLMIDALNSRDYPVVTGINLILATGVLVINLVVDLSYSYLDPRIKYK